MRLLPRSLLGRVYALYAGTLVGVVALGLGLFLASEMSQQVDRARADVRTLLGLVLPTMADNAVVGDYDAIQRQLQRLSALSLVNAAEFRGREGGRLVSTDRQVKEDAPAWLVQAVAARLDAPRESVEAGGTVYGELRLALSARPIAASMWRQAGTALALALGGVAAGLLTIRRPLRRWLGDLDRIAELDPSLQGGQQLAHAALAGDAPAEFRRAYEVLGRAAQGLQAAREQAAATLQAIDDAVFTCDVQGRVVLANHAALQLLQREESALIGQPVAELLPALAAAADPSQPGAEGWRHQLIPWMGPDGRGHVLDGNRSPVRDENGERVGDVLALRNVTEQHQRDQALAAARAARDAALRALRQVLEQAHGDVEGPRAGRDDIEAVSALVSRLVTRLREHAAQLGAIFALSPDGFVSFDGDGLVRYASPGFTSLAGLAPDMVLGLDEDAFLMRLRSRCAVPAALAIEALRADAAGDGLVVEFARPQRRVVSMRLHRADSDAVSQLLHLRDVTRETEVDRLKSEFIAAAAHELRTPMVGIYGFAELLCTREMPAERQKQLLGRIHRQCEVMVRILNEMLDLARLEAGGGVHFEPGLCDLRAVVAEAAAAYVPPPEREPPRWQPAERPMPVLADAPKLERALGNLLSNAYKYSPAGGAVEVRLQHDEAGARVGIVVQDHGIGLTPEQAARVGERFYRADDSGTVLGTGLGVSLVREIAALHRGSVELDSTPGQGTAVTLWLPLARETAGATPEALPA